MKGEGEIDAVRDVNKPVPGLALDRDIADIGPGGNQWLVQSRFLPRRPAQHDVAIDDLAPAGQIAQAPGPAVNGDDTLQRRGPVGMSPSKKPG